MVGQNAFPLAPHDEVQGYFTSEAKCQSVSGGCRRGSYHLGQLTFVLVERWLPSGASSHRIKINLWPIV